MTLVDVTMVGGGGGGGVSDCGVAWGGDGVSVLPAHGDAEALVDVGSRVTNIVVHQNGVPRFVRVLLMGGDNVTEAVAERLGVPFDQAEGVKQQTPLGPTPGIPSSVSCARRSGKRPT